MKVCIVLALALLLTGCSQVPALVEAMAKDSASVCVTVTSIYGTMKGYRTNLQNGTMKCDQDGMSVESGTK